MSSCLFDRCPTPQRPAPFDPVLTCYVHEACVDLWWEVTGPYPKPIIVRGRGEVPVWNSEDDADHLRSRGVLT